KKEALSKDINLFDLSYIFEDIRN
ncbi:DUF1456 domain-containing protein, partial [Acinetobacter baumannii]